MRLIGIVGLIFLMAVGVLPAAAQEYGTGWNEAYWNGNDFIGVPLISRTITGGVNFNWGLGSPNPVINVDGWVGRFASAQIFPLSTVYEFVIYADGGVRLLIDNVVIFDEFYERPPTGNRIYHALNAGTHQLQLQYYNGDGTAMIVFYWQYNMVGNGDFSLPIGTISRNWGVYSHPTDQDIVYRVRDGIFEFYRQPAPREGNSAVVLQNTLLGLFDRSLNLLVSFGNTSGIRKRVTILVHEYNYGDFFVCSFWVPPNTPLQPYRLIGTPSMYWNEVNISIYASNADGVGWLQVDDIYLSTFQQSLADSRRTLCYDPEVPPL